MISRTNKNKLRIRSLKIGWSYEASIEWETEYSWGTEWEPAWGSGEFSHKAYLSKRAFSRERAIRKVLTQFEGQIKMEKQKKQRKKQRVDSTRTVNFTREELLDAGARKLAQVLAAESEAP